MPASRKLLPFRNPRFSRSVGPGASFLAVVTAGIVLASTMLSISTVRPQLAVAGNVVPGSLAVVAGSGFKAGERLQLTWDGSPTKQSAVLADATGEFTAVIAPPDEVAASDTYVVSAVDPVGTPRAAVSVTVSEVDTVAETKLAQSGPVRKSPGRKPSPTPQPTASPGVDLVVPTMTATPLAATPVPATPSPTAVATPVTTPAPVAPPPAPATPAPLPPPPPAAGPLRGPLTLAAEFDSGLGPFAYDGQWGTGFGRQSDFMGNLSQVSVGGGVATIRAERKATPSGREWASAIMSTRGRFAQTYGYFEARIRYDAGNGLWPAFWMNPADGTWPPEIDILEAYPNTTAWPGPTRAYSTLHYSPSNLTHEVITTWGSSLAGGWHVYGVDWRPGSLTFYIDGVAVGRITQDVPSKPFYLILDLAVGNWSAMADSTTPSGATMQIDWVRVYQ